MDHVGHQALPRKMRFYLDSRTTLVGVGWTNCEKVSWPLQGPALPSWGECLERSAHASVLGLRADPSQVSLPPRRLRSPTRCLSPSF